MNRREFLKRAYQLGGLAALYSLGIKPEEVNARMMQGIVGGPSASPSGGGAVERTGSVYADGGTGITGATTYSMSVTVPADADCCIVITGSYGEVIDVLNFDNGGDNDFTNDIGSSGYGGGGSNFRVYAWRILSTHGEWPGSGSKTLYYSFNGDCAYGPWVVCFFLKNVNTTTPISDNEISAAPGADWSCPAMTVGASDLSIVAMVTYNNTVNADPVGEGQTVIYESANTRNCGLGIGEEQGEDVMRITSGGSNQGALAFVVQAAA